MYHSYRANRRDPAALSSDKLEYPGVMADLYIFADISVLPYLHLGGRQLY